MAKIGETTLEEIGRDESLKLLATRTLARLAVIEDGQPAVVPVNYAFTDEGIIVRTDEGAKLEAGGQHRVALLVDEIDPETHIGWSVLVRGHAFDVTETLDHRSERLRSVQFESWAPGPKARRLLVELDVVTGRRLKRVD